MTVSKKLQLNRSVIPTPNYTFINNESTRVTIALPRASQSNTNNIYTLNDLTLVE